MTAEDLLKLTALLTEFEKQDFSDLPDYAAGQWSRRNLEAIRWDVVWLFMAKRYSSCQTLNEAKK